MTHGGRGRGEWGSEDALAAEAGLELDVEDGDGQRTLLDLAVAAAGLGTFDWDLVLRVGDSRYTLA